MYEPPEGTDLPWEAAAAAAEAAEAAAAAKAAKATAAAAAAAEAEAEAWRETVEEKWRREWLAGMSHTL